MTSHYLPGQTWNSVFGGLSTTVEDCRAISVSEYLMGNKQLLEIFGYTNVSDITADDRKPHTTPPLMKNLLNAPHSLACHLPQHRSRRPPNSRELQRPDPVLGPGPPPGMPPSSPSTTVNPPPSQAHFSILKYMIQDGDGAIRISHDTETSTLTVHVDPTMFASHGKPALGRYLLRLHIWRCTADFSACKDFYEPLCAVDGEYDKWRQIMCSKPKPRWKFVQPNTFLRGEDEVEVKVYEASNRGVIQSWAERGV